MFDDAKYCAYCGSSGIYVTESFDAMDDFDYSRRWAKKPDRRYFIEYRCTGCGEYFYI